MRLSYLYFSQSSKFNRLKPKVKYRRKQNEIKIDILDFHALHYTLIPTKLQFDYVINYVMLNILYELKIYILEI